MLGHLAGTQPERLVNRLLVMLFVAAFVALALWDILRRNPQLLERLKGGSPPPQRPSSRRRPQQPEESVARGQLIELRRDPYQVLGLDRDASREEVEARVEQLRCENDPSRLADMSDDLQAHAARRIEEVEAAWKTLRRRSED